VRDSRSSSRACVSRRSSRAWKAAPPAGAALSLVLPAAGVGRLALLLCWMWSTIGSAQVVEEGVLQQPRAGRLRDLERLLRAVEVEDHRREVGVLVVRDEALQLERELVELALARGHALRARAQRA